MKKEVFPHQARWAHSAFRREAHPAAVEWLGMRGPWVHWVTLTLARPTSWAAASRHMSEWGRDLAGVYGEHIHAYVVGGRQHSGQPHFHVLLPEMPKLSALSVLAATEVGRQQETIRRTWRYGIGKIVDAHSGCLDYATKHNVAGLTGFGALCPRKRICRRGGCRYSNPFKFLTAPEEL